MSRPREKGYMPEPGFAFATPWIARERQDSGLIEICFALSRDRENKNDPSKSIWVPGGGGEMIYRKNPKPYSVVNPWNTAKIEAWQELGVRIRMVGYGPFHISHLDNTYGAYISTIVNITDPENVNVGIRKGAVTILYYYLATIVGDAEPYCKPQPKEPECETVDIKWLTLDEFRLNVENKLMSTYPSVLQGAKILKRILVKKTNPFSIDRAVA